MKLFAVESNTISLDGGGLFGNTPKTLWQKWMICDETNRIQLACRTLLVMENNGHNVLFDAGLGPFFEPKLRERYGIESEHKLLKNLNAIGISETDIDSIVLSHLHFDHAGGLLSNYEEGPLRLLFPNAKYYVSRQHWSYARNPHFRERTSFIPHLHLLLESSGRLVLIDNEKHTGLDLCRFHISNGHTVGLLIAEIDSIIGPFVYASDVIPGIPWLHLPITMGYDRFAALIVDEKQELLTRLSEKNGLILFSHDPDTVCANISYDGNGKYIGNPRKI